MPSNHPQIWRKTFPPFLAYKRLKALPKDTPCFEIAWYERFMRNRGSTNSDGGALDLAQHLRKTSNATVVNLDDDSEEERIEDDAYVGVECAEPEAKENLQTRAPHAAPTTDATFSRRTSSLDADSVGANLCSPGLARETHVPASVNASPIGGKRSASLAFKEEDDVTAVTEEFDYGEIQDDFRANSKDEGDEDDAFHEQDGEHLRQRLKEIRKKIERSEATELMFKSRAQRFGEQLEEMKLKYELATREL
ncbi:unnamed protein product [Zymoseptoria tritici ST99CH_1A5]|nr:unnamed protein product [Zymoseptoria tritici ST99CH_1A5]